MNIVIERKTGICLSRRQIKINQTALFHSLSDGFQS
jgi:hypothetical protein